MHTCLLQAQLSKLFAACCCYCADKQGLEAACLITQPVKFLQLNSSVHSSLWNMASSSSSRPGPAANQASVVCCSYQACRSSSMPSCCRCFHLQDRNQMQGMQQAGSCRLMGP